MDALHDGIGVLADLFLSRCRLVCRFSASDDESLEHRARCFVTIGTVLQASDKKVRAMRRRLTCDNGQHSEGDGDSVHDARLHAQCASPSTSVIDLGQSDSSGSTLVTPGCG
jgi:hypothetical protein